MSGIRPHYYGRRCRLELVVVDPAQETFFQGDSEAVITTKARVNVCRDAIFIILKRVAFLVRKKISRAGDQPQLTHTQSFKDPSQTLLS